MSLYLLFAREQLVNGSYIFSHSTELRSVMLYMAKTAINWEQKRLARLWHEALVKERISKLQEFIDESN